MELNHGYFFIFSFSYSCLNPNLKLISFYFALSLILILRFCIPSLYNHGIYSSIVADNIDCTDSLKSILPVAHVRSLTEQFNDLSNVTSQCVGRAEVPTDRVAERKIIQCCCFINE